MFRDDVKYLCCPISGEPLEVFRISETDADGEILTGELRSIGSGKSYKISGGIPRFIFDKNYNKTWDYKWTNIDRGKGINYKIVDKLDLAYRMHDIFDRNNHHGKAYMYARDRLVLDLGCGVGQYTYRLVDEYCPSKTVAMDLTRAVDIFRKIMLERFPQHKSKILMVQGNIFQMPFKDETFEYVFSLGVLMHTGNTLGAIRQAARVLKNEGQINIWIYASEPVPYNAKEPGRGSIRSPWGYLKVLRQYAFPLFWINTFRLMPHRTAVSIVRRFSSEFWYRLNLRPIVGIIPRMIFPTVSYDDFDYRFINNYDGYINTWDDSWNEHEIFPALRESDIVIQGMSDWRLGIWGVKRKGFYLN